MKCLQIKREVYPMIKRFIAISALCFALCWLSRLIFQFVVFTSALVEDSRLEKILRLAGTLLWFFLTALFAVLFAYQIGVI